jgi:hypothetical protein
MRAQAHMRIYARFSLILFSIVLVHYSGTYFNLLFAAIVCCCIIRRIIV